MKLKRDNIFKIYMALEELKSKSHDLKFLYGLFRNKKKMQSEVDFLREHAKPSDRVKEFEEKRLAMIQELAEKDENGSIVWEVPNAVPKFADPTAVEKKIGDLIEEYKADLDASREKEEQLIKFSMEEVDIDVSKFKLSELPTDITPAQMEAIIDLVEE